MGGDGGTPPFSRGHPMTCLCWHSWQEYVQLQPICTLGCRREWVVSTMLWLLYPQERPGTHHLSLGGPWGWSGLA